MVVVTVRLIGNSLGRAKVDATRDRLARVLVDNRHVDPVASSIEQFDSKFFGLDRSLLFHFAPAHRTQVFLALFDPDSSRRNSRHFEVGGTGFRVLAFAPTPIWILQEILG